jgi:hypothetical protein
MPAFIEHQLALHTDRDYVLVEISFSDLGAMEPFAVKYRTGKRLLSRAMT